MLPRHVILVASLVFAPLAMATEDDFPIHCDDLPEPTYDLCMQPLDGGTFSDASNACLAPAPTVTPGVPFAGWTDPPQDAEDNYALEVGASGVDMTVTVASNPAIWGDPVWHEVQVFAPGIGGVPLCQSYRGSATPGVPLLFTTTTIGTYTLRVFEIPAGDQPPLGAALPSPVPARNCHLMCMNVEAGGYRIQVG